MFCNKCGAYNEDNANKCSLCENIFNEDNSDKSVADNADTDIIGKEVPKSPKSYFFLSVILSILGSVPFGITAMVLSVLTDVNYETENYVAAEVCSKKSGFFCLTSFLIGIIKWLSILFWVIVVK